MWIPGGPLPEPVSVWAGGGAIVRDSGLPKSSQIICHGSIPKGVENGVPWEDHMFIQLLTLQKLG